MCLGLRTMKKELAIFVVLISVFVVPCILGRSEDKDPILKIMCSENGELFWKNFRECTVVLNKEFLTALQECIPITNETESNQTRLKVCSDPPHWAKMMRCLNDQLISLQNPEVELAPGAAYRTCVNVLISEFQDQDSLEMPFLLDT